jgi:hypothetical protein
MAPLCAFVAPRVSRFGSLLAVSVRAALLALCVLVPVAASSQSAILIYTNVPSLLAFPAFYHLKEVVVRGELTPRGDAYALAPTTGDRAVDVVFKDPPDATGIVEVRGQCWDVGRMTQDDPRFGGYDITAFLGRAMDGRWPAQGELVMLNATSAVAAIPPAAPTVRTIVVDPGRYDRQQVTVTGQFRGRNLYGDVPQAPQISKWDFVLRAGGAALWVTGLRPRGRGFELDASARVDTGNWLEVTGTVRYGKGLVWIEGTLVSLTKARPDESEPQKVVPPPAPPPEVVFSMPTEGETDVDPATVVQIQVSRDLNRDSLKDHLRIAYVGGQAPDAAETQPMSFGVTFDEQNRAVTIRFAKPLTRFRRVRIDLLDGIVGTDGQPLKPWALTFQVGG